MGKGAGVAAGAGGTGALGLGTSVGAASGAAVAGVVIAGLAVGAAIGTALRLAFGTAKAVRAEDAAVKGALALRETRADIEAELGRPLRSAELKKLFAAYEEELEDLGFVQKANGQWHRPRSAVERFLG